MALRWVAMLVMLVMLVMLAVPWLQPGPRCPLDLADGVEYSFKASRTNIADSTRMVYMFRSPSSEEASKIVERVAPSPASVDACNTFLREQPDQPYLLVGLNTLRPDRVKLYVDFGELRGRIEGREISSDGQTTSRSYQKLTTPGVFVHAPALKEVYKAVVPAYLTNQFDHSKTLLKNEEGKPDLSLRFKEFASEPLLVDTEITTAFRRMGLFSNELELWIRQMRQAGHRPVWLQISQDAIAVYYRTKWDD